MEAEFNSYPEYVRVSLSGKWELEEAKNALRACREAADSASVERILIDLSELEPPEDPMVRFHSAEEMANICGHDRRVSVVKRKDDPVTLGEEVARSRGVNLRVYVKESDALAWLLAG
jgi:hypothetical protein